MPIQATSEHEGLKELPSRTTFHLLPDTVWLRHEGGAEYLPEGYEQDGFVHCTNGEQELLATGNRYYRDDPRPFLLLEIDLDRLDAPVLYEDDERRYPHVYGSIARDAVLSVRRLQRDETGAFLGVGDRVE